MKIHLPVCRITVENILVEIAYVLIMNDIGEIEVLCGVARSSGKQYFSGLAWNTG